MRTITFAEHRGAAGKGTVPQTVEVARFKDENTTAPRVVAASQAFIVYSLKNRSALRVLPRQAAKQNAQLSYKNHTDAVNAAQFVNARSNIVASASEKELLVWYVDEDNSIYTYFSCPLNVLSFSWVPVANQPPDLLIVYANASGSKEAGLLKSSSLIIGSTDTVDGVIGKPDGSVVAQTTNITSLRKDLVCPQPVTSAASPIIAFSASAKSIVTTSLGNLNAPAWEPCNGDAVVAISVLPNELLVAVSANSIFIWDVVGEPVPLQSFFLGPRRCTALHTTLGRATLFLTTGNPTACEAVVFMMQPKVGAVASAFYDINSTVSPINSCVVPGTNDDPRLHVDTGSVLQVCLLQDAPWNNLDGSAPAHQVSSPKTNKTSAAAAPAAVQPPPYSSPAAAPARPSTMLRPLQSRFGGEAAASSEVESLKAHIDSAIANTGSMLNVAKSMVTKDHEAGVQEALKAQAKTLAQLGASYGAARGPTGVQSTSAFDAVIEGLMEPVASALVEGITSAIEEQLRQQLEVALRSVLTRQEKKKQRDQFAELRNNLDGVIAEVMAQVSATVQQKQSAYASRLIHYVSDVASEGGIAVGQLQGIIVAQQTQLQAITQSGILEEVKRLREEVAELKKRAAAGPAARGETSKLPRETVMANAQSQLASGNYKLGLTWVLQYDDPDLLIQVLQNCSEDTRNGILEDSTIPIATWTTIAGLLASTPKAETLEPTLEWLCDILAEKQELSNNDQLALTISNFLDAWKRTPTLSNSAKDKLRQIFLLVRK